MNNYRCVNSMQEIREYLKDSKIAAFDFETAPDDEFRDVDRAALDPWKSHIVGVSFSTCPNTGIYVPIAHRFGEYSRDKNISKEAIYFFLAEFAENMEIVKIAHNIAFESQFLYKLGAVIQEPCYCTFAAAHFMKRPNTDGQYREMRDSGLKTLVPYYFKADLPSFGDVTGGRHFDELDPMDTETVRYACADSDYALRLYHTFNKHFDKHNPKFRNIAEKIESPTAVYCGIMKYNGLLTDVELMEFKAKECDGAINDLRDRIKAVTGENVNIGQNAATKSLKDFLFRQHGLPDDLKKTVKGSTALDDEAIIQLSEWCEDNKPEFVSLFKDIQQYRRYGKIKSTYITGYKKHINSVTGRIHADLLPLGTMTGRFAAQRPNLQNMPRADGDEIGVRNFFIAPAGRFLLSLDFSQIELRVGAFYCRDEKMLEVYRTGGDIHAQTTAVVFKIPYEQAIDKHAEHYKERRTIAKNVNFGTFYGLFPNGLQKTLKYKAGLNIGLKECAEIIINLKDGYPKLVYWQEKMKKNALRDKYTETHLGRRRYLLNIKSEDWGIKSFAERCALNTPIQGTAADILKLALGRIIRGLPERPWLRPLLQIHDELVFEIPENKLKEAVSFVKKCMEEKPFEEMDVPIVAEAAYGVRFGELKEMEW